jgi:pyridoxamine 5'-phosphate oxidase
MDKPISTLRKDYTLRRLREQEADPDPLRQFDLWFDEAVRSGLSEPNGMTLATADAAGRPAARIVLLKGYDQRGFVFYTSFDSRKGRELAVNPQAALCFWWPELERQVRIEGTVEKTTAEESDTYFRSRPRESQLGACASEQSAVVASRAVLEQRLAELEARYAGREVPRPPNWGGYRLVPHTIEFWQGGEARLHDRLRYRRRPDGTWLLERLSP